MREIERQIVGAVIISKDGKLFVTMKNPKKGGVYLGYCIIPGGGVEQGESEEEALIREIKEETGMDISNYKIEFVNDTGEGEAEKTLDSGERVLVKMKFYDYRVIINDRIAKDIRVSLDDELATYSWVDLKELKDRKLAPPTEKLFKKLGYI